MRLQCGPTSLVLLSLTLPRRAGTSISPNIKAVNDALKLMQLEVRSYSKDGMLYHALVNQVRAGLPPQISHGVLRSLLA